MTDSLDDRLHGDATPPPHLARRVERTLRQRGLLATRFQRARPALTLFAAAACFALGVVAERWQVSTPSPAAGDQYVLLLYADDAFAQATAGRDLVGEYRTWAGALRAEERLVFAERLEPVEQVIGPVLSHVGGRLTGMFIIRAPSDAEAEAVSRASPHARYGGTVVVRRIRAT